MTGLTVQGAIAHFDARPNREHLLMLIDVARAYGESADGRSKAERDETFHSSMPQKHV